MKTSSPLSPSALPAVHPANAYFIQLYVNLPRFNRLVLKDQVFWAERVMGLGWCFHKTIIPWQIKDEKSPAHLLDQPQSRKKSYFPPILCLMSSVNHVLSNRLVKKKNGTLRDVFSGAILVRQTSFCFLGVG